MNDPYIPTFFKYLPRNWTESKRITFIAEVYTAMQENPSTCDIIQKEYGCGQISCHDCFLHKVTVAYDMYCGSIIPFTEADEYSDLTDTQLITMFFKWMHEYHLNKEIEKSMEESDVENNSDDQFRVVFFVC